MYPSVKWGWSGGKGRSSAAGFMAGTFEGVGFVQAVTC
jgi:hypothetical protein